MRHKLVFVVIGALVAEALAASVDCSPSLSLAVALDACDVVELEGSNYNVSETLVMNGTMIGPGLLRGTTTTRLVTCVDCGLENLTLQGGSSVDDGGGVLVTSSLVVRGVTFRDCVSGGRGGAIFGSSGAMITVENSYFFNVRAEDGGAIAVRGRLVVVGSSFHRGTASNDGGAIAVNGDVEIRNSKFQDCMSADGGGAVSAEGSTIIERTTFNRCDATNGGSLRVEEAETLTLTDVDMKRCTARGNGGAMYIRIIEDVVFRRVRIQETSSGDFGGAFIFDVGFLEVNDVLFHRCSGGGLGLLNVEESRMQNVHFSECSGPRGGCFVWRSFSDDEIDRRLTMTESTFRNCQSDTIGGGMYAYQRTLSDATTTGFDFKNVTFENNTALDGGAMYLDVVPLRFSGGLIAGNTATNTGGGLYLNRGAAALTDVVISGNVASVGGGIAVQNRGRIHLNGIVRDNLAFNNGGGAVVAGDGSRFFAGCAFMEVQSDFWTVPSLQNSVVFAIVGDDPVFSMIHRPRSGLVTRDFFCLDEHRRYTIWLLQDAVGRYQTDPVAFAVPPNVNVVNRTFDGTSGGDPSLDSGDLVNRHFFTAQLTGGDYQKRIADIIVEDVPRHPPTFEGNVALEDAGGLLVSESLEENSQENGATAVLANVSFLKNTATNDGGGCVVRALSRLIGADIVAHGNTAHQRGGAFAVTGAAELTMDASENSASTKDGGVLFLESAERNIIQVDAVDNSAGGVGGAVAVAFFPSAGHVIKKSRFSRNRALSGGALGLLGDATTHMTSTVFQDNVAHDAGGAIFTEMDATIVFDEEEADECRSVRLVTDWRASECRPTTGIPPLVFAAFSCDTQIGGSCAAVRALLGSDICDGCVCSRDGDNGERYFTLLQDDDVVLQKNPWTGSLGFYDVCLPPGPWTVDLHDVGGRAWFGATLAVVMNDVVLAKSPNDWTTLATLRFDVPDVDAAGVTLHGNRATCCGGAYFAETPIAALDLLDVASNVAGSYGPDYASPAARLGAATNGTIINVVAGVRPMLVFYLVDAYDQILKSDSTSRVTAEVTNTTSVVLVGAGTTCERGVCAFDRLAFSGSGAVTLSFHVRPTDIPGPTFRVHVRPREQNEDKNRLPRWLRVIAVVSFAVVFLGAIGCAGWTRRYRTRFILTSSHPRYLYLVCLGCIVSAASNLTSIEPRPSTFFGCYFLLGSYSVGFLITASSLFQMTRLTEYVIETALQGLTASRGNRFDMVLAVPWIALVLLVSWAFGHDPLQAKTTCLDWADDEECIETVRRCQSPTAPLWLSALGFIHILAYVAVMTACHASKNMPHPLDTSKWIAMVIFLQITVGLFAVPLLIMTRDLPVVFTVVKIVAVTSTTALTLALIFLPKIRQLLLYTDFDSTAVAAFLQKSIAESLQIDAIATMLSVKNVGHPRISDDILASRQDDDDDDRTTSETTANSPLSSAASSPVGSPHLEMVQVSSR